MRKNLINLAMLALAASPIALLSVPAIAASFHHGRLGNLAYSLGFVDRETPDWTRLRGGIIAPDMEEAEAIRDEYQANGGGIVYQSRVPDGICVQTEAQNERTDFGGC